MEEETITFGMPHTPIMQTESVDFSAISQATINTTAPKKESLPAQEPVVLEDIDYFFILGILLPMRLDPTTKQEDIDDMKKSYLELKTMRPLTPGALNSRADVIDAQRMARRNALAQERKQARILRDTWKTLTNVSQTLVTLVQQSSPDLALSDTETKKDSQTLVEQPIDMSWQDCTPSQLKQFEESQTSDDTDGK
jgi:hypothetical protein